MFYLVYKPICLSSIFSAIQLKSAQDEVIHLQSAMNELEATNQLLKDEYQTLQLALTSAEQKLIETQKENNQLGKDLKIMA